MSLRDTLEPDFLNEIEELLQQLEESVLAVEKNPSDAEAINLLFRVMHTIKGSAGMFSLDTITTFTHHLETDLDVVRKNGGAVSRGLIDAILASHDMIPRMLDGESCAEEVHDVLQMLSKQKILRTVKKPIPEPIISKSNVESSESHSKNYHIEFTASPTFFNGAGPSALFDEIREAGEMTIILRIDQLPSPLDETFDPKSCYLSWIINVQTALSENDLADMFIFYLGKSDDLVITKTEDSGAQNLPSRLGDILIERGVATPDHIEKALQEDGLLGTVLVAQGVATPADVKSALVEQSDRRSKSPSSETKSTIRVDADKLDRLVDLVGEMVTAQARLMSVARKSLDPDIQEVAEIVETLTVGLRDQTMSIRMVPISTILGGFNRLVRDLSRDLDKVITFETEGEDTELDKSVVEKLKEPLMHIIRNSADHGIESNEKRMASGKPVEGTIKVSAYHEGAAVIVRVDDDGGGLDLDVIRKRAVDRGLISAEANLTRNEIAQLICAPGFSTAEKVSNISGRGVGMDVVKRAVEALHGTLVIDTVVGQSTSMILRLPVTLAIIDGLMVTLDDDSFIIPLAMVEECVDLNHTEMERIQGREILNLRGEAVPFVKLRQRLERTSVAPNREQVVITMLEGRRVGIVVDVVIGSHQTVLKPLGTVLKWARDFSGATILGDGSVALIIDVSALIESHGG